MSETVATREAPVQHDIRASTLIVPLDGSVEATAALPIARALAQAEGATLHLLHVSDAPSSSNLADRMQVPPDQMAGAVLHLRAGSVPHAIVRKAAELGSGLIIMTSRCRTDERGTLGTVTREVLRRAPCPVVLVPATRPAGPWTLRQILLPHDGIPTTAAAIARAADLAQKSRAELAVLHIASTSAPHSEPGALMAPRYLDQPQHEWPTWAREFLDRVTALGGPPPGVRMRLFFACGEPADAIVKFVDEHQTDMVVIAWVAGWEAEQRTTMRKLIEGTLGPLLILPFEELASGMVF